MAIFWVNLCIIEFSHALLLISSPWSHLNSTIQSVSWFRCRLQKGCHGQEWMTRIDSFSNSTMVSDVTFEREFSAGETWENYGNLIPWTPLRCKNRRLRILWAQNDVLLRKGGEETFPHLWPWSQDMTKDSKMGKPRNPGRSYSL